MNFRFSFLLIFIAVSANANELSLSSEVKGNLQKFCYNCHDEDTQKGEIQLDNLKSLKLDARLSLLNKIQEQLHFGEMPPKKKKQPSEGQRKELLSWVSKELEKYNASGLNEKLRKSEYGNYVDHEKLFSGEFAHLPAYTKGRRWLISEFIFNDKINKVLDWKRGRTIDGVKTRVFGDSGIRIGRSFENTLRSNITNPFLLPQKVGVRYYDTEILTSGQVQTMMSNAKKITLHMTSESVMKEQYPNMYKIMRMEFEHKEILSTRKQFLTDHMGKLLVQIYGDENESLLPKFVSSNVPYPDKKLDRQGKPVKKEKNLNHFGLDYQPAEMRAIYEGIIKCKYGFEEDKAKFDELVDKCEEEWFTAGIHRNRLNKRVSIMKAIFVQWEMDAVRTYLKNRNIRLPVYEPLDDDEMKIIKASIKKHRSKGDTYKMITDKCLDEWESEFNRKRQTEDTLGESVFRGVVNELYQKILERQPDAREMQDNLALLKYYRKSLGNRETISKLIELLLLDLEYVYRYEFGQGKADKYGRKMMSPRDASYALAYALTDSSPDEELRRAAEEGRLNSREDYEREVRRMLKRRDLYYVIDEKVQTTGYNSSITNIPIRKLRFFREFFGYTGALTLFKDENRYGFGRYDDAKGRVVDEADMLVEYILKKDKNVFEELLSTEEFYTYHNGNSEAMKAASDREVEIYNYFSKLDWENFTQEEFYKHWPFIDKVKMWPQQFTDFDTNEGKRRNFFRGFPQLMKSLEWRISKNKKSIAPWNRSHWAHKNDWVKTRTGAVMRGTSVASLWNFDYKNWDYPTTQPAKVPNRKGMLTHPAWLISHSLNLENDPVLRGKWVREKLLAGTIPDVPITVDAVVPEDHHKTLRQRLEIATGSDYCWHCHERMNPLGVTFEIFDDFGRFRTEERLEHEDNIISKGKRVERGTIADSRPVYKTLPVNANGVLTGTGDDSLDGEVKNALELTERLAKSDRVRQSIIRYAFRYFMGRNEMLSDSKTLIDAEKAYLENKGSFDAVIISLLTSDSFIYRKSTVEN